MIDLDAVNFDWPDGPTALSGLNLRVRAGEKLVVLGGNGSGKSTLLKLLNGLVFATTGQYRYGGETVTPARLRDKAWVRRFRQQVVLLFQNPEAMLFNPAVREEIAYGPRSLGCDDADARALRWARELGIAGLLDKPPYALSGGQKQKVALAAILSLEPGVILLDEPTANLDPRSAGWLTDFLADTSATVIVSTHNLAAAAEMGNRCLILGEGGRLAYDGPVHAALANPDLLEGANLAHARRRQLWRWQEVKAA